ncbi:MAG TPA: ANTAR domain-containing protein [Methylibium sp.]|uniref:ANTAR domain-containing protein n=1 Tax=Methylibium sp. TaxID=2067992 RepID=UPI002DBBCD06|nr:ANTAR domain-containing protein [Methylibium sp.]HEU4459881.1 ANTAR domain-containing protein [Methylibium sp.]
MSTVFLIADEGRDELERDLIAAGHTPAIGDAAGSLLREVVRSGAEAIVVRERHPRVALLPALAALREHVPLPVLLFTADGEADTLAAALEAGVDACVVNGYAQQRLRPLLQLARLRFERDRRVHDALRELGERFEERKLVDRAKGILMDAARVGEDEAFRLLRLGSMRLKRRVGQVSQQVIDAARCAHAINRAGALRMLSQRVVLQHALAEAGVDADAAQRERGAALDAAQAALEELASLSASTYGDLLQAAQAEWQALATALAQPVALAAIDAQAEACLASADRLVNALQAAGYGGEPHVVNVCGRQRMLGQRLAKLALLKSLEPARAAVIDAAITATAAEFERALALLQAAPLGDATLRERLQTGVAAWAALHAATATLADAPGRRALAAATEAVLARFDELTGRYERSLDLLIG